jgi:hypothetical protein
MSDHRRASDGKLGGLLASDPGLAVLAGLVALAWAAGLALLWS